MESPGFYPRIWVSSETLENSGFDRKILCFYWKIIVLIVKSGFLQKIRISIRKSGLRGKNLGSDRKI